MYPPFRYCPYDATALEMRDEHGTMRPTCPQCGFIHYRNHVPAAGVILETAAGGLLVRRRFDPRAGAWCLPAGFMEFGESPEDCAVRELFEETGLRGRLRRLFNVYTGSDDPRTRAILIVFVAELAGGTLTPGDDAIEAGWFPLDEPPEPLAFQSHTRALHEYRAERERGVAPTARD